MPRKPRHPCGYPGCPELTGRDVYKRQKPFYLDDEAIAWVEGTLAGMTLEEKVGQLFCVLLRSGTQEEYSFIRGILSPGGAMYRPMPVEGAVQATNMFQQNSRIPLLIAANLEKGGNGIVTEGTLMGSPMEVAATDSADMAAKLGTPVSYTHLGPLRLWRGL